MSDETTIPAPDDPTRENAERAFEPTGPGQQADHESRHPTTSPRADPDAGPTSPAERGR